MTNTRYWVNVVSHEHVKTGVIAGITQSCHGKAGPLKRMHPNDWIVHYSPKESFQGKDPCQKFTSLGFVADDSIYEFDMGGGFVPWRRKIRYLDVKPVPIAPLLGDLSFTRDRGKNWGMMFRYGFFEMKEEDFKLLHREMVGLSFDPTRVYAL